MKRSAALAPLSRDHHQALAAALRLRRATPEDLDAAAEAFGGFWQDHGQRHFEIEEDLVLPALPSTQPAWRIATARVLAEHAEIRGCASGLREIGAAERLDLAHRLGAALERHVRFEERELFVMLEEQLPEDELAQLGRRVEEAEARQRSS